MPLAPCLAPCLACACFLVQGAPTLDSPRFGSQTVHYRIGNQASKNVWGGDSMPPPPPPTKQEINRGQLMAPVPYDVPRLPKSIPDLEQAGATLASYYQEMGVHGGGGGMLFGLRIDHVLHAIVGTPTIDGNSSPSRTAATLQQPLLALIEVVYADVLLALFGASPTLAAHTGVKTGC